MQVFITILGLTVPSYGLCIAAGMITANLAAFVLIRRRRMDEKKMTVILKTQIRKYSCPLLPKLAFL